LDKKFKNGGFGALKIVIDQKVRVNCSQSRRDVKRCASVGPWPAADIGAAISFHGAAHALLRFGDASGRLKKRCFDEICSQEKGGNSENSDIGYMTPRATLQATFYVAYRYYMAK